MTIFQIVALLFALFMIYVTMIHFKKKTLEIMEFSFWVSLWLFFSIIALFPNLLKGLVHVLNFTRVFDLLVVMAFMLLSTVVFYNYFSLKEILKKIETTVRNEAIKTKVKRSHV